MSGAVGGAARPLVAIDGPAGSGKSTLARRLAETLDLPYLNTGLMYRTLTLEARRRGVNPDDGIALGALAREMTFDLDTTVRPPELRIGGASPPAGLTSPEVESTVSRVARHPEVRAVLRAEQRRLCAGGGVVEGRDIGTVVAPAAHVKLFLAATETERIARRSSERRAGTAGGQEAGGKGSGDAGEGAGGGIARSVTDRDALDARTNPLVPAADAIAIDTTGLDADAVFERALGIVRARLAGTGP